MSLLLYIWHNDSEIILRLAPTYITWALLERCQIWPRPAERRRKTATEGSRWRKDGAGRDLGGARRLYWKGALATRLQVRGNSSSKVVAERGSGGVFRRVRWRWETCSLPELSFLPVVVATVAAPSRSTSLLGLKGALTPPCLPLWRGSGSANFCPVRRS